METYTCECGAQYTVRKFKTGARDKDEAKCDECHNVMKSWNGGAMYIFTRDKSSA